MNVTIFPSAGTVPENLLRFHVAFDTPPFADQLSRAVHLIDENGIEIEHAFLDLAEGLWDSSGKVLTLMLHPGRIKSGLQSRAQLGSALQRKGRFCLELDSGKLFPVASDKAKRVSHHFEVTTSLTTALDPSAWCLDVPGSGTRDSLRIRFDRPMDRLSLTDGLFIRTAAGVPLDTDITIGKTEIDVTLTPSQPWAIGMYEIVVSPELEDVAGNRILAPMESVAQKGIEIDGSDAHIVFQIW